MVTDTRVAGVANLGGVRRRRADVQDLRAVAILLVVAYHAGLGLSGGFVGVDVFFVISGFVISGLLLREFDSRGEISLGSFYIRRIRRLFPALALMWIVTLLLSAVLLSPLGTVQPTTGRAASAASSFVANAYFFISTGGYFQPTAEANPFLHTWSLSVEEQFYVFLPVVLVLGLRLSRKRRRAPMVALIAGAFTLSFVANLAFSYDHLPQVRGLRTMAAHPDIALRFAFYSPVTRAWEFLAGVLITLVCQRGPSSAFVARTGATAGAVLLAASASMLKVAGSMIFTEDLYVTLVAVISRTGLRK